jgi:anion-transporting  ArsA/GET3 family ATPase
MTRVRITCGIGGAGKTTTAAALALAYALQGQRVVVLTIDPARRLADALGIDHLANTPQPLPLPPDAPAGARLDALMLDRKATWDEMVRRHAPDEDTAERVLSNRYYVALSERLTGGHEYMATEKLYALVSAGTWDVVVVDTPPAQHALEFFSAPDRIRRILDRRMLSTLLGTGDGLLGAATRSVVRLVQRLAGESVMQDLTEFFHLVADLSVGLRERSAAVHELLRSNACEYLLVVHADNPNPDDAHEFVETLRAEGMRLAGSLINRSTEPLEPDLTELRRGRPRAPDGIDPAGWDAAIDVLLALAAGQEARAQRHAQLAQDLRRLSHAPAWPLPDLRRGVDDLEGLTKLAAAMPTP